MLTTEEKYFFQFKTSMDAQKPLYYQLMREFHICFRTLENFVPKNTDIKGRIRINVMMHILAKVTAQKTCFD